MSTTAFLQMVLSIWLNHLFYVPNPGHKFVIHNPNRQHPNVKLKCGYSWFAAAVLQNVPLNCEDWRGRVWPNVPVQSPTPPGKLIAYFFLFIAFFPPIFLQLYYSKLKYTFLFNPTALQIRSNMILFTDLQKNPFVQLTAGNTHLLLCLDWSCDFYSFECLFKSFIDTPTQKGCS